MKRFPFNGEPILTNGFRDKYNIHLGEDYALGHRTALVSQGDGVVIEVKGDETRKWLVNTPTDPFKPVGYPIIKRTLKTVDYGNFVKIYHGKYKGKDLHTLVSHLDEVVTFAGQKVKEGQLVGYSDSTGNSTGNHVHVELRLNNKVIDPNNFNWDHEPEMDITEESNLYVWESRITVPQGVGKLFVRAGPATSFKKVEQPNGRDHLTAGDSFEVVGFVKGERVKYGNINTQFWWKSKVGNYIWAGGTGLIPSLDNYPDSLNKNLVEKKEVLENMEEVKQQISDLEVREEALKAKVSELDTELKGLEDTVKAKDEEFRSRETELGDVQKELDRLRLQVNGESVAAPAEEAPTESPELVAARARLTELDAERTKLVALLGL